MFYRKQAKIEALQDKVGNLTVALDAAERKLKETTVPRNCLPGEYTAKLKAIQDQRFFYGIGWKAVVKWNGVKAEAMSDHGAADALARAVKKMNAYKAVHQDIAV